ncbi:MAG: ABC transporter permease [Thermodesulfovibrionales bacterium]|nr:ABC transporter permease [Thermodesulfovibrionales bacterium]
MAMGWFPIFYREMLIFKRKLLKLGYLFSAMVVPIIYLLTFGLGLGRDIQIEGIDYITYLLPGLVAMSSMNNSYTWVASALNLNRIYFKTFQIFVQAPIYSSSIMIGEVLAGMIKGLFASILILLVGFLTQSNLVITIPFLVGVIINCFMFASLGVITGMITKTHEDTSTYNNFFILPMSFFSGTFFPVDRMPVILKNLVYIFPLTHTNILVRKATFDHDAVISLCILILFSLVFFCIGSNLIKNYCE